MSKQSKMTGADYLLLLLYLDNCSAINGAIRITKMMFLFNMEIAPVLKKKGVSICDEDLPKFSAYNYGPFSKDVYEQVELFQSIGFIKVKNLYATEEMSEVDDWEESAFETEFSEGSCQYSSNQDGKFMQYKLLNLGKKYVESEIIPQLTNDQLAVLTTYKQRIELYDSGSNPKSLVISRSSAFSPSVALPPISFRYNSCLRTNFLCDFWS